MSSQTGWRWCYLCQGLFYSGNPTPGVCPSNGTAGHSIQTFPFFVDWNFAVLFGDNIGGAQAGWRWCRKCQGFFFGGNPGSVCPAGQAHDGSESGHYALQFGDSVPGTQGHWRWCRKCQGLFNAGNVSQGVCPADKSIHDGSSSGQYGVPWQNPTTSFDSGTGSNSISIGGNPADCNLAVSSTHVCVTARSAFACYTKAGQLVSPGPGFAARPYTVKEFFEQNGISTILSVNGDSNTAKDGRVVFDINRKRFFMVFQSREATGRLLIAVSKSEDPSDGWFAYADVVGSPGELTHDYQWVGVNSNNLLVSDNMVSSFGGSFTRTRHLMYSAADLASGNGVNRGEWWNVGAQSAVPCVHNSPCTDAFWVHRDDGSHASVWAVRNGNVSTVQFSIQAGSGPLVAPQQAGTVDYTRIGQAPQSAQYRDGKIVFVTNDGTTWPGQPNPNSAVHLVRLDVSKFFNSPQSVTVEIDRLYGLNCPAEDPPGSVFDYGWPAVATNQNGDIVVGSVRCNPGIFTQLRASVWYRNQPDISPSMLIAQSQSALSQFHMAGACADPTSEGVYLAQQFGVANAAWQIRVVKMLDYPL